MFDKIKDIIKKHEDTFAVTFMIFIIIFGFIYGTATLLFGTYWFLESVHVDEETGWQTLYHVFFPAETWQARLIGSLSIISATVYSCIIVYLLRGEEHDNPHCCTRV